MSFTTITVTGTFEGSNGEALAGRVTALLSTPIQNGTTTVQPIPVMGTLTAGKLSIKLVATTDGETLPIGAYYTFKVEVNRAPRYEFKAILESGYPEHTVDITKLYESSGFVGAKTRPQLSASPTLQELSEVLVDLGLAEQVQKPFARDL